MDLHDQCDLRFPQHDQHMIIELVNMINIIQYLGRDALVASLHCLQLVPCQLPTFVQRVTAVGFRRL